MDYMLETPTKALPAECAEAASKLVSVNASTPLNLVQSIATYMEGSNRYKLFQGPMTDHFLNNPSYLQKLLDSRMVKLPVEDSTKVVQFINNQGGVSQSDMREIFEKNGMMGVWTEMYFYDIDSEPFYESMCTTDNLLDMHRARVVDAMLQSHLPLTDRYLEYA